MHVSSARRRTTDRRVARAEEPVKYLQIIASLMPRDMLIEHNQVSDLSDDEVNALLEYVQQQRAKLIEAKPEPRMISRARRPKATPVTQAVKIVGTLPNGQR
jgi:hypothetical protein